MTDNIVHFPDIDRHRRNPDAVPLRNPADVVVIVLPVVRCFNAPDPAILQAAEDVKAAHRTLVGLDPTYR